MNVSQLPPHFMGHDIVQFYNAALALQEAEKSEYETTDQFTKRIEAEEAKFYMGRSDLEMTLAFVAPILSQYNADNASLRVAVECDDPGGKLRKQVERAIPIRVNRSDREYLASNAFNAKTTVHSVNISGYWIAPSNAGEWPTSTFTVDEFLGRKLVIGATISMMPEVARRIRPNLSALIICSVVRGERLASDDFDGSSPTMSDPYSEFKRMMFLHGKVVGVWFFDSASGKIYAKAEKFNLGNR